MTERYNVNLNADWLLLKPHVFKEFKSLAAARLWTVTNLKIIKAKAQEQELELGITEPVKRRVNITQTAPNEFGIDVAIMYITT